MTPATEEKNEVSPNPALTESPAVKGVKNDSHFLVIDGLRGFAAGWVLIFHTFMIFFRERSISLGPLDTVLNAGPLGVALFLVLSGFCISWPYAKRNTGKIDLGSYAKRRALRILPPYYIVCVALYLVYLIPAVRAKSVIGAPEPADLITHLLGIHNLFPQHIHTLTASLWTIGLEIQLYVLFPFLWLLKDKAKLAVIGTTILSAAILAGILFTSTAPTEPLVTNVFVMWPLFAAGMFTATYLALGNKLETKWGWGALLSLAIAIAVYRFAQDSFVLKRVADAFAGIAACIVIATTPGNPALKLFTWPPLVKVGIVSFSVYMIHGPIVTVAGRVLGAKLHGTAMLGAAAIGTIAVAIVAGSIAYRVIEKPFHELARRSSKAASA